MYLNEIFFGNTAYGIQAAAKVYFKKELSDITLAEGALLASLPKAPSKFSPLVNMPRAKQRQKYVLGQMVKVGFINQADSEKAYAEDIKVYPASQQNLYHAPYFLSELRKVFQEKFPQYDLERDGLTIKATLDLYANDVAERSLRAGLRKVDKRRGWRGVVEEKATTENFLEVYGNFNPDVLEVDEPYKVRVSAVDKKSRKIKVDLGTKVVAVDIPTTSWSFRHRNKEDKTWSLDPISEIKEGDVVEVALNYEDAVDDKKKKQDSAEIKPKIEKYIISQTPDIEGSLVSIDPNSGKVLTIIGGYSYARSVFNRATQSLRQPGSTFKPIVYLTAVDGFKYTPATIVSDTPRTLKVGDQLWTPGNYDNTYLGPITLQVALERSRNMVSVDIVSRIGISPVIQYAKRLGITNPIGKNPSIALGSSEVTPFELTRAYGVFPAGGVLNPSSYIESITDRKGEVVYERLKDETLRPNQVISPQGAFIMATMMKGVIQSGTATVVKPLERPAGGKTGTTNNMMDTWFIGFTPDVVTGIWVGFDQKKEIGEKETGGKVSAPIFLDYMKDYLNHRDEVAHQSLIEAAKEEAVKLGVEYKEPAMPEPRDFSIPEGVEAAWISKGSGLLAEPGAPGEEVRAGQGLPGQLDSHTS